MAATPKKASKKAAAAAAAAAAAVVHLAPVAINFTSRYGNRVGMTDNCWVQVNKLRRDLSLPLALQDNENANIINVLNKTFRAEPRNVLGHNVPAKERHYYPRYAAAGFVADHMCGPMAMATRADARYSHFYWYQVSAPYRGGCVTVSIWRNNGGTGKPDKRLFSGTLARAHEKYVLLGEELEG